jgi:hypothetical protein
MTTAEKIAQMDISALRSSFSTLMGDIVHAYGDNQEELSPFVCPVTRATPASLPGDDHVLPIWASGGGIAQRNHLPL